MDLITVYIPTKNRAYMLDRALISLKYQSYNNLEVIVVDDGSDDNTYEIIKRFDKCFINLIYIRNEVSKGACYCRNIAISRATGTYICGLDDDDEFVPERIEMLRDMYLNNKYSFISSCFKVIDKKGSFNSSFTGEVTLSNLYRYGNISGPQVFTSVEKLKSIGGFDESFPSCQDYDCWTRLVEAYGNGLVIPQVTYIQHKEHDNPRISSSKRVIDGRRMYIKKHRDSMNIIDIIMIYKLLYVRLFKTSILKKYE
ncbi:glycosyltransferase [Pseudoalteromonas sp. Hal273]